MYIYKFCTSIKPDKAGIKTFNDIEIIDDDKHPLIAITESIQDNEKSD